MGRPREHDHRTAEALLTAAEELVREGGEDALSVRAVAARAETTTRAIYSLFGGREGLLAALGARAFDLLRQGVIRYPRTEQPAQDLVDIGVKVFRRLLIVEHPVLFGLGVQRPPADLGYRLVVRTAAEGAWPALLERVARLGVEDTAGAATAFHAMCEGLGALELRGYFRPRDAPGAWRTSLRPLVIGLATSGTSDVGERGRRAAR